LAANRSCLTIPQATPLSSSSPTRDKRHELEELRGLPRSSDLISSLRQLWLNVPCSSSTYGLSGPPKKCTAIRLENTA
jgi:hypothetical protein